MNTLKIAEILIEKPYLIIMIAIITALTTYVIVKIANKRKDKNK